ncbi:SCO family protein [Aestuariirhabdus litorea]|uniref:SCO family protein n=1 Tax=Aestuariirhabdus litorea TaxID=2528527 RepID=A0A3P3VRE2_9GAMM|nr:SCO family protein [Aestuariirhabdus litorea]RRJ85200.1 hypothetical protein D0544_09075 [Aestuariirhabdus litorea]RWW98421.1 hypothetical protein DZC74_09060 [Endozoicomonadaceae bacterium GTF-13]
MVSTSSRPLFLFALLASLSLLLVLGLGWLVQWGQGSQGITTEASITPFRWQAVDGVAKRSDAEPHYTYLFLGLFSCSQVCPLRIGQMVALERSLEAEERLRQLPVRFLFVTLDPRGDTPSLRHQLIDSRSSRFHSARMEVAALSRLQHQLRDRPLGEAGEHGGALYLLDPQHRLRRIYSAPQLDPQRLLDELATVSHSNT